MPLSPQEKSARREARYYGKEVLTALAHMQVALNEAKLWGTVDLDQQMFWEGRANKHATTAYVYARKAAREALHSIAN